jgi:hypothetical protein
MVRNAPILGHCVALHPLISTRQAHKHLVKHFINPIFSNEQQQTKDLRPLTSSSLDDKLTNTPVGHFINPIFSTSNKQTKDDLRRRCADNKYTSNSLVPCQTLHIAKGSNNRSKANITDINSRGSFPRDLR